MDQQEQQEGGRCGSAGSGAMGNSPLPHIIESMDDFGGGKPKDRLVSILDRIEMHVEQLRKDAIRIEEEKDTLLTTLDTLRNNDVVVELEDSEFALSLSCLSALKRF